ATGSFQRQMRDTLTRWLRKPIVQNLLSIVGQNFDQKELKAKEALRGKAARVREDYKSGKATDPELRASVHDVIGPAWNNIISSSAHRPTSDQIERAKKPPPRSFNEYSLHDVFAWVGRWYDFSGPASYPWPKKPAEPGHRVKAGPREFLLCRPEVDA